MSEVIQNAKKIEKTRLWTKNFALTTITNFFLFLSFQLLIPTLPVYTELQGGDETAVGLVIGVFTITSLLTRPFAGVALDTVNRRYIVTVGLIIFTLSVLSYNWTTTVLLILILRSIHGIGWGIATTSFGTIISDIIPSKRRGEGMGYYGLSSTLAMAIGPFLGNWIMNTYGFQPLFYFATSLAMISILLSQFMGFNKPNKHKKVRKTGDSFIRNIIEKDALFPSLLLLLFTITYGGIVSFITLFGKEIGIENVGLFFMGNAIMVLITRPIAGRIFDRMGHRWVIFPGTLFVTTALIILSYTDNLTMLLISSIFYGIGFGSIQPALQAWTINRVAPERRGAANATFFSAMDLGIGTGSMLLGLVAKLTSYRMMYRYSILLIFMFLAFYFIYLFKSNKEKV